MDGSSLWGIMTVIGPILLMAVLIWAVVNNRRSKAAERRTEAATRDLYKSIDREEKASRRGDA